MGDTLFTVDGEPRSAEERFADRVSRLVRGMMHWAREEARTLDLTFPEVMLLGGLRESGPIPLSQCAEARGIPASTVTGLLDALETRGFVRRSHGTEDRRQVIISLTPSGQRISDQLKARFLARWSALCEGIPARELEHAAETMDRILARQSPSPVLVAVRVPAKTRTAASRSRRS
jgi:MarR family transcriptional regulator, organic hydroperoxide resistance regulator